MTTRNLKTAKQGLQGTLTIPGDKSISHRAVMLGSFAQGITEIRNLLHSADVKSTIQALRALGVEFEEQATVLRIRGRQLADLHAPSEPLDMGNSGTTTRLLMGLFSRLPFDVELIGDGSLSKRPMDRVAAPLRTMGAKIDLTNGHLPARIHANDRLQGVEYTLPVASAQVKTALIFATLQADTVSHIEEPVVTRDHSERMLLAMQRPVERHQHTIIVRPGLQLVAPQIVVPGDFSSAAFWLVAGLIVPQTQLYLQNVGINPTRTGLVKLLQRMGATITVKNRINTAEPVADLSVVHQQLHGIEVVADDIPGAVDEIPMLVLAATQANGLTIIHGAQELRVKETDRIATVTTALNKLGAQVEELPDGFKITGPTRLHAAAGTMVSSHGDHRIGMMLAIAALITDGQLVLEDADAVDVSYPQFFADLEKVLV